MNSQNFDYHIYITISDELDREIPFGTWLDYVKSKPGFSLLDYGKTVSVVWDDQGRKYERELAYVDGVIHSGFLYDDNPDFDPNVTTAGIRKMLAIAEHFGAKVIDEEFLEYRVNGEIFGFKWIYHPESTWERWKRFWREDPDAQRYGEMVPLSRWDDVTS